jgi:G3E family GTPase
MENLNVLYDELVDEQTRLQKRLEEVQDALHSISKVLQIIEKRKTETDTKQISFIKDEKSNEYADITFEAAALDFLARHPNTEWEPKDIGQGLLAKGFKTRSKRFNSVVRSMFSQFRTKGIVNARKIKKGKMEVWLYKHKENVIIPLSSNVDMKLTKRRPTLEL